MHPTSSKVKKFGHQKEKGKSVGQVHLNHTQSLTYEESSNQVYIPKRLVFCNYAVSWWTFSCMCCSRALHPCEADKSYTVYRKPFPSHRASECDDQQALHMYTLKPLPFPNYSLTLHSQTITISKLFPCLFLLG